MYWKIPFMLRLPAWLFAAEYGTSVALRHLGLGDPPVHSIAELTRVLTFAAVAGMVGAASGYAEQRHQRAEQERHEYDRPDA